VLSYFCAGRAVLLAVPKKNLAAKITFESGAGHVVDPDDIIGFCAAAERLIDEPELRSKLGQAGRRYAESHFDIHRIGDQFELILSGRQRDK
jgi:glycosyltransferase involved in cell wall biosynthesis